MITLRRLKTSLVVCLVLALIAACSTTVTRQAAQTSAPTQQVPSENAAPSPTPVPTLSAQQVCDHDRALLAIAADTYSKTVNQVSNKALTADEAHYLLGQLALNLSNVDMVSCAKPGQDALFMAIASRASAYDHYTQGKTAQAAADLQGESVYLARYETWRKAQPATTATPFPTPSGATTASTARSWVLVKAWEGDGSAIKQTEPFTVGSEWRIDWLYPRGAYFGLDIYEAGTGTKVPGSMWTEKTGADTTFMHRAGTYYLSIVSDFRGGSWKVDVQDGR